MDKEQSVVMEEHLDNQIKKLQQEKNKLLSEMRVIDEDISALQAKKAPLALRRTFVDFNWGDM